MMNPFAKLRRGIPLLAAVALFVLAASTIQSILQQQKETYDFVSNELETALTDRVVAWETSFLTKLDDVLEEAAQTDGPPAVLQTRLRRYDWFDSIYTWTPPSTERLLGKRRSREGAVVFPRSSYYSLDTDHSKHPCIVQAKRTPPASDAMIWAKAFLEHCAEQSLALRLFAAS